MSQIPDLRRIPCNDLDPDPSGKYVLYWMIAQRRYGWSFALDRAVELAEALDRPLLVFEPLRCGYPWASDRLHQFVIEGMVTNARRFDRPGIRYYAYVERDEGEGSGLLEALAEDACALVTDHYPCFFLPRMVRAAAKRLDTLPFEMVDGNGLLPIRATEKAYSRAVDFRRYLQKNLAPHLLDAPRADPLDGLDLPEAVDPSREILDRWGDLAASLRAGELPDLSELPIDHSVAPAPLEGGTESAEAVLDRFLEERLDRYNDGRLDLENPSTSELSAHLHFGHISAHQVFHAVADREDWTPDRLSDGPVRGSREGWWGMSKPAESFLDELITWRELGWNGVLHIENYDTYGSLPEWARASLEKHADDERPEVYTLEELEAARTYDEIWNAAQRELVREGRIHNYLRMLWGKKIFEWSEDPRGALDVMIELNNKYALDGRDPNSYSGIFWCLGRYDRAWGPERKIYGKIRYMTSDSTRRKITWGDYLERFGPEEDEDGV